MTNVTGFAISQKEFQLFQQLMFRDAGVTLAESKKALVCGRLSKRLKARGCNSFTGYHEIIRGDKDERQTAIDLLTTNETYFFREPKHFEFLRSVLPEIAARQRIVRAWSAACSSGEEVYTIAMVLAEELGESGWSVLGSDINTQVLQKGRTGHYAMERIEGIPPSSLRQWCLKGKGRQAGTFLIDRRLRQKVEFRQVNLNAGIPSMEPFDLVFLRNVMIYFSPETKAQVVRRLTHTLRPGGYLFIGHSESLNGMENGLEQLRPSIYRKPA